MINILEVIPSSNDATSLYRARLPLLRLQKLLPDKIMIYPHNNSVAPNWDYILLFDMVFLQRPVDKHYFNIFKQAKIHGLPVWIDYDDLLCSIPVDNPSHDHHTPEKIEIMGDFIRFADIVTVSTTALKINLEKKYKIKKGIIKVIPNALDLEMFPLTPEFKNSKNIMWRGSHTHMNDLMEFSEEIVDVMNSNKSWKINFMGYNPFFITGKIKNFTYTKFLGVDKYLNLLPNLNNSICIIPLHDSNFNHSKSNIAWIESTYAGAVCLAPDWEEWRKPGVVTYKNKADFKQKLKAMVTGAYDLKRMHQESWQFIRDHLSLAEVNKQRLTLIMR